MLKFRYAVLCALATFTSLCLAQSPQAAEPADEAARLIGDLGSPLFQQRQNASEELSRLGESALAALEQWLKSPDAEIRFRCERLKAPIRDAIRKEAEEKRFREFFQSGLQAEGNSKRNWERFQNLVDGDPAARALFIELHEYDPAFLKLAVETPERVPAWAAARRKELLDETWAIQNKALIRPKVRMMVKQVLALPNPDLNLLEQTYQFGGTATIEDNCISAFDLKKIAAPQKWSRPTRKIQGF